MPGGPLVLFHGTRGSIPTPEPANARYGGNTACVEVVAPDASRVFLDAGTGIRRAVPAGSPAAEYDIVLTHFHWDHVQGLPFFAPLHDPDAVVRIHAPCQHDVCLADLLGSALAPIYFPVPYDRFAARISLHALEDGGFRAGSLEVSTIAVHHPSTTHGVRVRCGEIIIVYVPDNELEGCAQRREALVEFARGADLLVHDAMFTGSEYAHRRGWGHSTFEQAAALAHDAGARRLLFFHHDPGRSDDELDRIIAGLGATTGPLVGAAREQQVVRLMPAAVVW
jgi:phosphoribosyl 1,2-cyclic phosphodiesterase